MKDCGLTTLVRTVLPAHRLRLGQGGGVADAGIAPYRNGLDLLDRLRDFLNGKAI